MSTRHKTTASSPNLVAFRSPQEKARFVQRMFDRISPRYDLMNRLMTFGQDVRWRKLALEAAALPPHARVLDIACGTGDLAFTALEWQPELVVAADFSLEMLRQGMKKSNGRQNVVFLAADGLQLPFADGAFDAVVTGFSMRNVVDIDGFLQEMRRVVRPGGRVVILEITPLKNRVLRPAFQFYFHRIVPFLGGLIAGDREAYTYLPQSVEVFVPAEELRMRMEKSGLHQVEYKLLNLSTVALHWGEVK